MSSWFAEIRKDPNMASTVKELSDRLATQQPALDDDAGSIRLLRIDTSNIHYEDTDSISIDGDLPNTDNINYDSNDSFYIAPKAFRVPGGDFLTFHVQAGTAKFRDFVGGEGGFVTQGRTRAYVGYSEVS